MLNALRFQNLADRLTAARAAMGELHATVSQDPVALLSWHRTAGDVEDAARLFDSAQLLFIKINNLLTIVEWNIERLSGRQPNRPPS